MTSFAESFNMLSYTPLSKTSKTRNNPMETTKPEHRKCHNLSAEIELGPWSESKRTNNWKLEDQKNIIKLTKDKKCKKM